MSRFGGVLVLVAAVASAFTGCGTSAVGVDECRAVEDARCAAAQYCAVGITSASLEQACERFSRDNCLHGLPGTAPRPTDLQRCVAAITASGTCARRAGRKTTLAQNCTLLNGTTLSADDTVCDVIQDPELSSECGFLNEQPAAATPTDAGTD